MLRPHPKALAQQAYFKCAHIYLVALVGQGRRQQGARLRASRVAKGMSQEDLAEQVGKSVQTISALEYLPACDTLLDLASALDVPLHTLLVQGGGHSTARESKEFEGLAILRQLSDADLDLAVAQLKAFLARS